MDYLNLFSGILGVAGTVGAASAIFYASRSRGLITLLKEENEALDKANTRLEKDLEVQAAKCASAEEKAKMLQDMVTQAPSIIELTKSMNDNNKEVTNQLGKVATELARLTKAIGRQLREKK